MLDLALCKNDATDRVENLIYSSQQIHGFCICMHQYVANRHITWDLTPRRDVEF